MLGSRIIVESWVGDEPDGLLGDRPEELFPSARSWEGQSLAECLPGATSWEGETPSGLEAGIKVGGVVEELHQSEMPAPCGGAPSHLGTDAHYCR